MTAAPATAPAVEASGLRKSYGDVAVLRGIDLTIPAGRIYALLGANGAGKTTTVRILSTLTPADAGTARVAGFDVVDSPRAVRASISLTGQFAAVDGVLTGRENLALIARLRHVRHPARVAQSLLDRFELAGAADRRVSTYSGGMRRRLDLAMSLVGEPPVLFLDEPTTGLDPQSRLDVWAAVRDLAAGGTTVLLTTQYLDEAEKLADRIAILHQGRILVEGSLRELRDLLPPARVEYVEKQPSLEEIFLALTASPGDTGREADATHPEETA